ncbi:MAG: AAA family ATPase [Planctomycetes bacterium]|nr:AAA family ATPase [Planctomycetota bacterium]
MNETAQPKSALAEKLVRLRTVLGRGLIERDTPIRLALLAALSGEHLLLIGPPGTAKSELARRLRFAFAGATYFERLLTKFSVPEELFGPLSIKALEQDRYHRQTKGYLPEASVAFLDEIFKANSAILNALLTLLNERLFDNGDERTKTKLITVVGASNELPSEREQLDALFDRFLFRCHVPLVSNGAFPGLLSVSGGPLPEPPDEQRLTTEEVESIQKEAAKVQLGDEVVGLLAELREFLLRQKIEVSDRRWVKMANMLKVSAYTNGRAEVSRWDCWLLQHCTWSRPEQRQTIQKWYEDRMGTASATDHSDLHRLTTQMEAILKDENAKTEQSRNERGEPLYQQPGGAPTTNPKGKRGEADPNNYGRLREVEVDLQPLMQPMHYSGGHIRSRVSEVEKIEEEVESSLREIDAHIESIATQVDQHIWISPGFTEPAKYVLQKTRAEVAALKSRLDRLKRGFENLHRSKSDVDVAASLSSRRPK